MNARGLRKYIDDLLRGRRPKAFAPDDFETAQIRTAIELRAARPGDDEPRPEFLNDLHARLAEQMTGAPKEVMPPADTEHDAPPGHRRDVGRRGRCGHGGIRRPPRHRRSNRSARGLRATHTQRLDAGCAWRPVPMCPTGSCTPSTSVRSTDSCVGSTARSKPYRGCARIKAAGCGSTHPTTNLHCPCHTTSFAPSGQVLTHQLPIAPKPLPSLMVREVAGAIEVFAAGEPRRAGLEARCRSTGRPRGLYDV